MLNRGDDDDKPAGMDSLEEARVFRREETKAFRKAETAGKTTVVAGTHDTVDTVGRIRLEDEAASWIARQIYLR